MPHLEVERYARLRDKYPYPKKAADVLSCQNIRWYEIINVSYLHLSYCTSSAVHVKHAVCSETANRMKKTLLAITITN